MRNSNLLKWAQNMNNKSGKDAENRNWIHPPEALSRGHIAYLVKFLGNLEVDQPKGIEVVKEGIRKLKFNQQNIRKSEGSKLPKVELTISVDGVAIQEPKTKRIMHQYPLHRISYCADDKAERRFFSFIVKETPDSEQHQCFVFLSDKLAEDITLTIGQAFDLAYKWCGGSKASKRTFRSCHLDVNKPLPLYYSDELPDLADYCAGRAVPQMPSGMEKDEEAEHHLQRAMVTGHVIPTPEVYPLDPALYDRLYPPLFTLPRRLIHMQPFTLEQDIPAYDIDSEDESWLRAQAPAIDLPSHKFEEMVDRLERNSDHTVVSEQDAKALLRDCDEGLIIAVYDYWLNKRFKTKHNLMPLVKTEVRGNTAVNDPYLAFRRRKDKMQTRKNRKNDESSYEKMIKLSCDLTSAQDIVEMIKRRELLKKDLVQVSIELFKKRYALEDWTGAQYQEAVLALRHTKLNHSACHKKFSLEEELGVKKEKRHYKKRKLKSATPPREARLSSDEEAPPLPHPVEDNYFTFRRAPGVAYQGPRAALGDWPWAGGDVRHRFNPVLVRTPATRCVGLARRRVGRGGRVILDRLGPPLDDLWRDLDVTVLEGQRHFRPKTPPNAFSDESEVEDTGKVDTLKPFLEVDTGGHSTHINISFNKPFQIEGDTTTNILERISEDTGHGSILDPFYKSLIKKRLDLLKTSSSLVERWNKLSTPVDAADEQPYAYEESLGSASLRLTNSRKSFLDTAACERVAQKRKYDARAASSRDLDERPRCSKCRKVQRVDEALGEALRARDDSLRAAARGDPLDVKRILETLVFHLKQRVEINEQIRAELRARLSSVQRETCSCGTSRGPHRLSCPLFDPSHTHPPPPRLTTPAPLSHPPLSSPGDPSTKDRRSPSDDGSLSKTSPGDDLSSLTDHRTLDGSTCICDIFPSTSSNTSSPAEMCSLVSSGRCLLSNRTRTSGLGDHYLLPETGLLVRRTQDCLVDTDRRFLEMEAQRRLMVLQARVHSLEAENLALKTRLSELALCDDVASYMRAHNLSDLTRVEVGGANNNGVGGANNGDGVSGAVGATNGAASSKESSGAAGAISNGDLNGTTSLLLNLIDSPSTPAVSNGALVPPVPPRSFQNDLLSDLVLPPGGPSVGRKLEGLLLDDLLEDEEFDPRAHEAAPASAPPPGPPLLAPPPPAPNHRRGVGAGPPRVEDVFGLTPFNDKGTAGGSVAKDPFGMGDFGLGGVGVGSVNSTGGGGGVNAPPGSRDLESAIGLLDRRILEMKDGFSRGLSIGTEDFSIESLDPLRK